MNWKTTVIALAGLTALSVWAQDDNPFAQYREMFGDDNPAELVEFEGEILWAEARGPNNVSLEQCDLGLGPGVVEGAYAQLPRYFEDADAVMDLEMRLVYCMEKIQGFDRDELVAKPFSEQGQPQTPLETLSAYIAGMSRGAPIAVPQDHPKEQQAYQTGKKLFTYRAGPYDFSCATCHAQPDKRIRLQALPDLTSDEGARFAYSTWPGYRISQGTVRTMQWRVGDCFRQQRLPELVYGSDAAIGLITYMGARANGEPMAAPGLKR
ncbi:sulfur oxidation c-type cytochrome SoxA [Polycyclovorans algicola]|uniref:sulfur oxidation c-type cytochrome SoxA n=1 Tax=Polycyclovorans algicola TaxID=616992 RepID=UPI0004A71C50|nr:sulfur oxidation c-type cytochrome SoxA [Polycyclovorans algicola]